MLPGSVITQEGIYKVSHSSGHLPDAECFLMKGTLLPSCGKPHCDVTYTFLREGSFLPDNKNDEET